MFFFSDGAEGEGCPGNEALKKGLKGHLKEGVSCPLSQLTHAWVCPYIAKYNI